MFPASAGMIRYDALFCYIALVFPASAGMIRYEDKLIHLANCVPRIRGDDLYVSADTCRNVVCSPHPRG